MGYSAVLFDLDGTLTDSGEGIMNSARLALTHFGLPIPPEEALRVFVGPPLRDTFLRFGVRPEQIEEAIRVFRSHYLTVGKYENFPSPGFPELLQQLRADGLRLYVATSKPEETSVDILQKFGLAQYFDRICGASADASRDSKAQVIAALLEEIGAVTGAVMVGDTAYDVTGAAAHGIPTIGVTWGYGEPAEIRLAGAVAMADTPQQLYQLLHAST